MHPLLHSAQNLVQGQNTISIMAVVLSPKTKNNANHNQWATESNYKTNKKPVGQMFGQFTFKHRLMAQPPPNETKTYTKNS